MLTQNIKKIIAPAILILGLSSCSENIMDDINANKNNPEDVASRFIITDVMTSSAFNVTGSDYAFYASTYVEHNVGIYNQMYNAEIRNNEPYSASTYNNSWNNSYNNLLSLKLIIEKCSQGGKEAGNYQTLGIAQILSAYNLAILTDLMGDVPWTEALQPGVIYQPKLDKQEDIYNVIYKFLDDAITNLNKTSTYASLGSQDLIYKGNNASWIKMAYGLKARYLMHLSARKPNYQEVIDNVNKSFTSISEQAVFKYDGSSAYSPFYRFFTDRDYFGASASLHAKLNDRNDPRDNKYFKAYPGANTIVFAPNGDPKQEQGVYGISALSSPTAPTYLLSYHELQFLKAEAYARLNQIGDAEAALKLGIQAAFLKVGLTTDDASSYYSSNIKSLFDQNPIKEIMVQKYLSFFEEESIEAYNDIRRLKANGENFIQLSNTKPFPLRFTYGNSDVTTNPNVRIAYGDGQYVKTEGIWWAGGTR